MEIITAERAGACYGVKRALDLVLKASETRNSVQTLGPLIHNPQVVARLESRGITVADSPSDITAESIIIRSHGITPAVRSQLESSGATIVDATCPHVLRAQHAAQELAQEGRTVLVVGE